MRCQIYAPGDGRLVRTSLSDASIIGMMSSVRWTNRAGFLTRSAIWRYGSAARRPSTTMYSMALAIQSVKEGKTEVARKRTSSVVVY